MTVDSESEPDDIRPANDNIGGEDAAVREALARVDRVALRLARIIGRRMAREDFAARVAANDNRLIVSEGMEDGADKE